MCTESQVLDDKPKILSQKVEERYHIVPEFLSSQCAFP